MTSGFVVLEFKGDLARRQRRVVCSGPVTHEEREYLIQHEFLELGSDGEYYERETLVDSDSDWDTDEDNIPGEEEFRDANESPPTDAIFKEYLSPKPFMMSVSVDCSAPSEALGVSLENFDVATECEVVTEDEDKDPGIIAQPEQSCPEVQVLLQNDPNLNLSPSSSGLGTFCKESQKEAVMQLQTQKPLKTRRNTLSRVLKSIKNIKAKVQKS